MNHNASERPSVDGKPLLSAKKRMFFPLVLVLIVLCFFPLLEIFLRFAVPSLTRPLVTETTIGSRAYYEVNRRYLEKYFPGERSAVIPELHPTVFSKEKGKDTFRVVCLGGSSMFGTPYEMNATIPAIVRRQLRHLHPHLTIEMINLGASAINSSTVLDLATEVVRFKPDLVLVYMGHNEFYGPDGVGASYLQREFPSTIQWVYSLRDLRIFRLAQGLFSALSTADTDTKENLMETVSQNQLIPLVSSQSNRIFAMFRRNLRRTITIFHDNGVPVIVSDVTSNLSFPPFASEQLSEVRDWNAFCAYVKDTFKNGSFKALRDTLTRAYKDDSTNAFVQYWLGRTLEALKEPERALPHLRAARDDDLLKFRAPGKINDIIRQVSSQTNTLFVSSDSLFSSLSPGGIADTNLFWEHLHPNARGYYHIADLFVRVIELHHLVPDSSESQAPLSLLPWNPDSLGICWLDLAFGDISMRNLTTHWPFSDYKSSSVVIGDADPELQRIAWNVYTYKLGWTEGCYKTALYFQRSHRLHEAQTTYEAIIEDNPRDFYAHYLLAVLLKGEGTLGSAIDHYRQSIKLKPDYPYPRIDLGLLLVNQGQEDSAIDQLDVALLLTRGKNLPSEKASIYYGLSAAYANLGNLPTALAFADTSLSLVPRYTAAQDLRRALVDHLRHR